MEPALNQDDCRMTKVIGFAAIFSPTQSQKLPIAKQTKQVSQQFTPSPDPREARPGSRDSDLSIARLSSASSRTSQLARHDAGIADTRGDITALQASAIPRDDKQ